MHDIRTGRAVEFVRNGVRKTLRDPEVALTILMVVVPLLVLAIAVLYLAYQGLIYQEGFALQYALVVAMIVLFVACIRYLFRRRRALGDFGEGIGAEIVQDPTWGPREREVFQRVCNRNLERTNQLNSWDEKLIRLCCDVAEDVARDLSHGRRGLQDVPIPEILGLVEQVPGELREIATVRVAAPLLRNLHVSNFLWVLRHRHLLAQVTENGMFAVNLFRLAINPPAGAVRIIDEMIADDRFNYLGVQAQIELQRTVLDYVASKAIDLYSGRFRNAGQLCLPAVTEPIRILVAGQAGAGKTTLAAAIARKLTPGHVAQSYTGRFVLKGQQCTIVEAPGFNAIKGARKGWRRRILPWHIQRDESVGEFESHFLNCDMLIWVLRADQPARRADADALEYIRSALRQRQRRRMPPLVISVTHVDRPPLIEAWPASNKLSPAQLLRIDEVARSAAKVLRQPGAVPLKLALPDWNLDELLRQVAAELPEACYTQINRLRAGNDIDRNRSVGAPANAQEQHVDGDLPGSALPTGEEPAGTVSRIRKLKNWLGLGR